MPAPLEPSISQHSHPHGHWQLWRWAAAAEAPCTESLVLLHAAATHPQAFTRLAHSLMTPGREILAPALNGYGASVMSDTLGPVQAHVAIASAALDAVQASADTLLFGHSMGGLIALLTALEHPSPRALALYDPIVTGALDTTRAAHRAALQWDRGIISSLAKSVAQGDPEAGVACFVEGWNESRWTGLPPAVRTALVAQAPALARDAQSVSYFQLDERAVRGLRVPTRIMHGASSPDIIGQIAIALQALAPAAVTTAQLSDCGHMAPVMRPDALAVALGRFFAETAGA